MAFRLMGIGTLPLHHERLDVRGRLRSGLQSGLLLFLHDPIPTSVAYFYVPTISPSSIDQVLLAKLML